MFSVCLSLGYELLVDSAMSYTYLNFGPFWDRLKSMQWVGSARTEPPRIHGCDKPDTALAISSIKRIYCRYVLVIPLDNLFISLCGMERSILHQR